MGCGLVSQRGASVEVHHPLANDPASRAAGARVVTTASSETTGVRNSGGLSRHEAGSGTRHHATTGEDRVSQRSPGAAQRVGSDGAPNWRSSSSRRFVAGERVVSSRLPSGSPHDHAFCFECGVFFQLGVARPPSCTRCGSSFVQILGGANDRHWITADSTLGAGYTFEDGLDNSITASLDETPVHRRPTQGAFLRGLLEIKLTEEDIQEREALGAADPRCKCTICRDAFAVGDVLKRLPCSHEFHESCCATWLASHNTCPLCRFNMPEEEEEGQPEQKEAVVGSNAPPPSEGAASSSPVPRGAVDE